MSTSGGEPTRLDSWKAIAAWFRRSERTVKRWEAERGLPVHRLPGGPNAGMYAHVAELAEWLRSGSATAERGNDRPTLGAIEVAPPLAANPAAKRSALAALAAAAAAILVLGLTIWGLAAGIAAHRSRPAPAAAERFYFAGSQDWAARTPASLNRAVGEFRAAVRLDPDYAEAWTGLGETYDLLREYSRMPPSQAYPLARAAAQRALALDDGLARAHAVLAFADFWGFHDAASARREFARAVALDPTDEIAHHWFATFLAARGDFSAASRELVKARALDPASPSIAADQFFVDYQRGRRAEAVAGFRALAAAHPQFLSPHVALAYDALLEGRDQEFLEESAKAARLTGDRDRMAVVEAARAGLAKGGRRAMLAAMLAEEIVEFRYGRASALDVAGLYALSGDPRSAIAWLSTAIDRREDGVSTLSQNYAFKSLFGDPTFQRLARQGAD